MRQYRQRIFQARAVGTRNLWQQPGCDLPIAANPAMAAAHVAAVARRSRLVQLHVAEQSGTGVTALKQIVTEDPVLREALVQGLLKRVYVVDPLADERTFLEQILINVGYGAGVWIDARLAATELRVTRPVGTGKTDRHARLQDAVSVDHELPGRVVARAIERVRHGAGKLPCGVARQQRVSVERNHVLDLRQCARLAYDPGKLLRPATAQDCIERRQLAALALVTHPETLSRIPAARPVKQEEMVGSVTRIGAPVLQIQSRDKLLGPPQQRVIRWQRFADRITKIGQQPEMQIGVAVGEEAHLKCLGQVIRILQTGEHGGYYHQRTR